MGGEEIKEILTHLESQLGVIDKIIISPHRKILQLRHYLNQSRFRLINEEVIFENGQFYQIMVLTCGGQGEVVTSYGSSLFYKGQGPEYKAHQIHHFRAHKDPESEAYFAYLVTL
jgi:tRNA A22 N-methylase